MPNGGDLNKIKKDLERTRAEIAAVQEKIRKLIAKKTATSKDKKPPAP